MTEYCSGDNGNIVTLELMKKYYSSLNAYENRLTHEVYLSVLKQILLSQLVAFDKYGFVHNDLHLGNILLNIHDEQKNFNYNIANKNTIVKNKLEIIISDFDNSICYDSSVFDTYDKNFLWNTSENKINWNNFDDQYILTQNIINTIDVSVNLLKLNNEEVLKIKKTIDTFLTSDWLNEKNKNSRKKLRGLFKKNYSYERYKREELNINISIVNSLFELLTNEELILFE